jgi:hypothetical protein
VKPTDVYTLVGCRECDALWIVADRPETTNCPRCQTRHPFDRLKSFAQDEDEALVREARTRLLATRQGDAEAIEDLDHYEELETEVEEAGIADEEYLEAVGIDAEAVAEADSDDGGSGSESRKEIVRRGVHELDAPTAEDVLAFANERDVPRDRARKLLDRMVRAGEVSETGGEYRAL